MYLIIFVYIMNLVLSLNDGLFTVSVILTIVSIIGFIIRYCYKSKYENVKLCYGLLELYRRVDLEIDKLQDIKEIYKNDEIKQDIEEGTKDDVKIDLNDALVRYNDIIIS